MAGDVVLLHSIGCPCSRANQCSTTMSSHGWTDLVAVGLGTALRLLATNSMCCGSSHFRQFRANDRSTLVLARSQTIGLPSMEPPVGHRADQGCELDVSSVTRAFSPLRSGLQ